RRREGIGPRYFAARARLALAFRPSRCAQPACVLCHRLQNVAKDGTGHRLGAIMGDKSPKSKNKSAQQKKSAQASDAAAARTKQEKQSSVVPGAGKGRK